MRNLRMALVAFGLLLSLVACGTTDDDVAADSTTTVAEATETTAATTEPTETTEAEDEPTTTEGGSDDLPDDDDDFPDDGEDSPDDDGDEVLAPVGDEKLIPLLLEPTDFDPTFVYDDASDDSLEQEFCEGVSFTVEWQATASMSAAPPEDDQMFLGANESILAFEPGDAEKFMDEFPVLNERCNEVDDPSGFEVVPLEGVGDEALKAGEAPVEDGEEAFPIEFVIVRVGDNVAVLFSLFSDEPLLSDALVDKAVENLRNG